MYSTIVHPTDLSESSIPALKTAHELAKRLGSKLLVCYVAHPPMVASGTTLTNPETNESRDITEEVKQIQPFDPTVRGEVKIITIDDSSDIKPLLAVLENMDCNLLVLGMHKKKGLSGWFSKSITEEVVKQSHCNVLVVKDYREAS